MCVIDGFNHHYRHHSKNNEKQQQIKKNLGSLDYFFYFSVYLFIIY
jgi:hypothetical protein